MTMATGHMRVAVVGVFVLGAVCGGLGRTLLDHGSSAPAHAQSAECNTATLSGTYAALVRGYSIRGADGTPLPEPVPRSAVNVLIADGEGNITRTGTLNVGGVVSPNPATGTYTVNPDCTFTVTYPPMAVVTGVLLDGGRRAFAIAAGPAAVQDIVWERQ
jgi:hypothetical protein